MVGFFNLHERTLQRISWLTFNAVSCLFSQTKPGVQAVYGAPQWSRSDDRMKTFFAQATLKIGVSEKKTTRQETLHMPPIRRVR